VGYGKENAPATFDEVAALTWFRDRVCHIVQTYSPEIAAVRYPEVFQPKVKVLPLGQRCRIEGVLMAAVSSCGVRTVLTGSLVTIAKNLGSKTPKRYLETKEFRGLDWSRHKDHQREAILVAASALPEEG
jgi:hypothetical protein